MKTNHYIAIFSFALIISTGWLLHPIAGAITTLMACSMLVYVEASLRKDLAFQYRRLTESQNWFNKQYNESIDGLVIRNKELSHVNNMLRVLIEYKRRKNAELRAMNEWLAGENSRLDRILSEIDVF